LGRWEEPCVTLSSQKRPTLSRRNIVKVVGVVDRTRANLVPGPPLVDTRFVRLQSNAHFLFSISLQSTQSMPSQSKEKVDLTVSSDRAISCRVLSPECPTVAPQRPRPTSVLNTLLLRDSSWLCGPRQSRRVLMAQGKPRTSSIVHVPSIFLCINITHRGTTLNTAQRMKIYIYRERLRLGLARAKNKKGGPAQPEGRSGTGKYWDGA
jgi:hypothetical protein